MNSPRASKHRATDVDAQIGAKIRRLRIERGLSQDAMGELLGVTYQQLHKYEHGTNRLSAARLLHLLSALQVDATAFMAAIAVPDVPSVPPVRVSELDHRIHSRLARMTSAQRRGLMAFLGGVESADVG